MSYKGKIVIVTGSSTGLGAHLAVRLAGAEASGLVIHGRNEQALKEVKEKIAKKNANTKVHMVVGDIGSEDVRQKLINETVQQFGKLDVLVNNAGIWNPKTFMETKMDEYDKLFNVNVRSVFALTQLAVPHLLKSKGNVVNISSELGKKPLGVSTIYGCSKAALDHFTKCLAIELGPQGVRVNSVNPSSLPETDVFSRAGVNEADKSKFVSKVADAYPLRRVGTLDEVCDSILYIASDKATFVTGTIFSVDGGSTLVG
jgi:NAD(P)-dependent dehydrogenase (short-subunit alcohol dehydrogenase family)